jgi:hypothetical protein
MDKLREGTPAITVGGEPLEDHLEREEGKEKQDETEKSRKQEIVTKSKHKKKFRPRERFEDDPARVSKRVRHLSPFEIRKEYGVKEQPFPTLNQNVLYVLFNAGDALINSKAISDELDKSLQDVSSALSNIWKKLKDERIELQPIIFRKRVGLAFQYRMTDEGLSIGFEELYRKFWKATPVKVEEIITTGERTGPYAQGSLRYKRTSKNVIDLISRSMGEEFLAREIAAGVGKPPANISSTLQMVIKRLEPHGMIDLIGGRSSRSYKLHPGLRDVSGDDLIEFIQSHKKYYAGTREKAWEFFNERLATAEPRTKPTISFPDPAEEVTVTAAQVTELVTPLIQRIIALESDGLEETITTFMEEARGNISHQGRRTTDLVTAFEDFKEGISADIKDIFDLENKSPGEFNINFNVRLLFGR